MATPSIVRDAPVVGEFDDHETCAHNPPVVRILRVFRALVALLSIGLAMGGAVLPHVHAHFVRDAEGRLHAVVHQHWALHHLQATRGASVDDEESATYFDQSSLAASPFAHTAPAVLCTTMAIGHGTARRIVPAADPDARPHGPPRSTASLRSPPRTA
jgi:hypothetical protein